MLGVSARGAGNKGLHCSERNSKTIIKPIKENLLFIIPVYQQSLATSVINYFSPLRLTIPDALLPVPRGYATVAYC